MQIKAEQLYLGYDEENIVKNLSMTPPIGKISVILGA
ncbi:MAG TPA: ferric citrate ABC transporter ATP-binding protein FecE, partial [Erysipelotrichaceae bacterium]|nr:ferric citrate ABC transporter ATP-binding protein FecE [Erysipelotrichaceae bacterium]